MKRLADITCADFYDPARLRGQPANLYHSGPRLVADATFGQLHFTLWGPGFTCDWVAANQVKRISLETPLFDRLGLWPRDATPCGLAVQIGASLWHEYLLAIPAPIRRLAAPYGPAQWRILEQLAADPGLARRLDLEQAEEARNFASLEAGDIPPLRAGHTPGRLRQLRSHAPGTTSDK